jgi:hypothetical protein
VTLSADVLMMAGASFGERNSFLGICSLALPSSKTGLVVVGARKLCRRMSSLDEAPVRRIRACMVGLGLGNH